MALYTEAVQKLYVAYFSRPADAAGLTYWENVVTAAKGDTTAVSKAFAASQEYKDTFAGQSAYQVINTVYQNLFGRPAEAAALTFWGQGLLNGTFTIDNAVTTIAAGAQGADGDAYKAKVAAATAFTAALDTPAEILGYNGTAANNAAKAWLAGIKDETTLKAATEAAALNSTVGTVTNPPIVGQTYVVGTGVETLVGTSANDTFNARNVDANGDSKATLNAFDSIDGGAGTDTLNVYTSAGINTSLPASASVKNVEIINLYNTAGAEFGGADGVAAGQFVGATQIWQIGSATKVTGLAASTTAGFRGLTLESGSVTTASGAASANIALEAVKGAATTNVVGLTTTGTSTVNVSGTIAQTTTGTGSTPASLALGVTAVKDAQTVTVNSAVATTLTINDTASALTKKVTTVNAAGSAGAITFVGDTDVNSITTGAGADTVTLAANTAKATTTTAALNATVSTGAGKDSITINTTGDGEVTVDAGAGDDTVTLAGRGTGKLTVLLGDGADTFKANPGVAIQAGDNIDAGAGIDTLSLSLVGSANIGAFSNFDLFDAAGLARTLDVEILSSKNTVTEFIASGNVGAGATLSNVGANVGVRVTADMAGSTLTVLQKTAGALTVTVDADETRTTTNDAGETVSGAIATNATAVKAVFDTSYLADNAAEALLPQTADNYTTLSLTAEEATSLEIVSGGANASNNVNVTATDKLTSITVTGAQNLTIGTVTGATKLATIDASAQTGGLIVGTNDVANGGVIKLGSGVDAVTVAATSTTVAGEQEQVFGFEKAAAAAAGTEASAARTAAWADADTLVFANGTVANANAAVTTGTIAKGVLTFTGAGPADLAAAFVIANNAAETAGEVVIFEYLGNSYVFQQGAGGSADMVGDLAVKLVGITGVTEIGEVGTTDGFFLV
ncbi:hypothetical protein [Massilia sp. UBA6681]|uniref:hypothetical protein n=1 Tax=Massilia sp. UBA6681 TaxID=1946839 RepID=UPI0025C5C9E6|nr:hypothetical protein [Massilia sp. UBA6681]